MNRASVASSSGLAATAERIAASPARASGGRTERIAMASTGTKRSARSGCSAIASEICRTRFQLGAAASIHTQQHGRPNHREILTF